MTIGPQGTPSLSANVCQGFGHNQDTYKRDKARLVSINLTVLSEPRGWLRGAQSCAGADINGVK